MKSKRSNLLLGSACICVAPAVGVLIYTIAAALWQFIITFYMRFGLGYTVVTILAGIGVLLALIGFCIYGDHTTVYEWY